MKKQFLLVIAVFIAVVLLAQFALAEEIILNRGETKEFKGIPITLEAIGSSGSAHLKVGAVDISVTKTNPKEVHGLSISIIESMGVISKLNVKMTAECLINSDCIPKHPCSRGFCILRKCKYESLIGCPLDNNCRQTGTLSEVNGVLSYCSESSQWLERKTYKTVCTHNYECLTNYCDKSCKVPPEERKRQRGERMAPAWILVILGILIFLKYAIFIINPKKAKKINRNYLENFSDKHFRIVAIIICLVALAMIVWALM